MASKKSVSKMSKKKSPKSKTASKKKSAVVTSKKNSSLKTQPPKKAVKSSVKKKTSTKSTSTKQKLGAKKAVTRKPKASPKKAGVKVSPKPHNKKIASKKAVGKTKQSSISKKVVKKPQTKKSLAKRAPSSVPVAPRTLKPKIPLLSANERYNIGGLFACAIERRHDPDGSRLRAALRHLDLGSQEKDNLIRLSNGFMIPKLFADNLPEPKVNPLLADLAKFAMKQGSYEKYWREEIQQIGFWLGVFPAQFQAIEHQVKR